MEEIWKPIKGYESLYEVSNLGNVKSLNWGRESLLKPYPRKGYYCVCLCKNNICRKFSIHRLVAEAFIPNPNNLPQVNHIDEDKTNNRVDNLEWCDSSYNINYGCRNEKVSEKQSKAVNQYSKDGVFIKQWKSIVDASRELRLTASNICNVCQGKRKSTGGFIWRYA